ncbi:MULTISPECIES: hypothetical protein [unclassified Mucilaginibacter]|uniref:hypothetical protein n=1 Tax=unclassified Mucilaginibacter TaxID=2617802 RepID=UPI002AC97C9E|nr:MULTISPECIES: hypothetical protein [unclassified Mucilaginibacter]MEB0260298.1 hypothetical protein [Mucilaginibacter sp. 10I4]MEB0277291.1 hypothetical protein [Mucilaginibacter sp. 10B2]MEB0302141.1 hypothetical protein [Mucilaginibacter sp. 5C4]WPX25417.1 hypothetical protein RHM67_09085 [Mucilaginibacter sp. 5C4]
MKNHLKLSALIIANNLKRMGMVKNTDLFIPGHDMLAFSTFPSVMKSIVRLK